MDQSFFRDELGEGDGRRRNGEVDQPVGIGEQRRGIDQNLDAVGAQSREFARIAPDHRRARGLDRPGEGDAVGVRDRLDDGAPRAPSGAGHDQPHVGHGFSPQFGAGIAGWRDASNTGPSSPTHGPSSPLPVGERSARKARRVVGEPPFPSSQTPLTPTLTPTLSPDEVGCFRLSITVALSFDF